MTQAVAWLHQAPGHYLHKFWPSSVLYAIVYGYVAVPVDALHLEPPDPRTRKKHNYTYKYLTPHTDPYKRFFSVPHYSGVELSPCQRRRGCIFWVLQDSFCRPSPEGPAVIRYPNPPAIHSRGGLRITLPDQTRPDRWCCSVHRPQRVNEHISPKKSLGFWTLKAAQQTGCQ